MKDRILKIMQKEGLTNAEFAEKIGISTSSLSHIFSGRNKPSLEVVMRIHKACPYVNINWLLYGEGEMEESAPAVTGMDRKLSTSKSRIRRLPKYAFSSTTAPTRSSNPKNNTPHGKSIPPGARHIKGKFVSLRERNEFTFFI